MHAERMAARIRRSVQTEMARGINDPRITGMVSITEVRVAPDLADATILVSVHPEDAEALTLHGLRSAAKHFRSRLARTLGTRRVPRLHFKVDRSLKLQAGITNALAADGQHDEPHDELDELDDRTIDHGNDHERSDARSVPFDLPDDDAAHPPPPSSPDASSVPHPPKDPDS